MSAVPSSPLQLPKANCSSTWPLAGGKPFHDDSISHAGPIVCSEKCQGKKPFRVASEAGCSPDVREVGGKRASWGRRLWGGGAVSGTLAPVQAQFLAARPKPGFHSLSLRLHPTKHFSESVRCCSGPPRMQARQILSSLSGPLSPRESLQPLACRPKGPLQDRLPQESGPKRRRGPGWLIYHTHSVARLGEAVRE